MLFKRIIVGLAATALLTAPHAWAQESPEPSGGSGGDNVAVAINTKDGKSIFDLAFSIRRVVGDVVDNANVAVAWSTCEECRTVAVAIQIVLVFTDPAVVTPTNLAIAVNQDCTSCETLASAYQWVIGTGGPVTFTKEGKDEITAIRKALKELAKAENLTLDEIQAELDALMDRLDAVLRNELVPVTEKPDDDDGDGLEQAQPTEDVPTPGPSPSEASPSPEVSP